MVLRKNRINLQGTSFPLADANGNCVSYIDNAGNVQAHYTYDAFGNSVSSDGDMADDFPFRFSSKYLDDETGLYYYGFRYLSPALGRWGSRDPIGERSGPGLYLFLKNDDINGVDKLGLFRWPWQGCCNGEQYNRMTHCCCDNNKRVRDGGEGSSLFGSEDAVDTGIRICNDETVYGSHDIYHWWVEMDYEDGGMFSAGFHGADPSNLMGGPGLVKSPAGDEYTESPGKKCTTIYLNPCMYNISRVRSQLKMRILMDKKSPPRYILGVRTCAEWANRKVVDAGMEKVRQGECGGWKILN